MTNISKLGAAACAVIAIAGGCTRAVQKPRAPSQATAAAAYDPVKTFAPLVLPDPAGPTRAADGAPGPAYWQNRADYTIHAAMSAGDVRPRQYSST